MKLIADLTLTFPEGTKTPASVVVFNDGCWLIAKAQSDNRRLYTFEFTSLFGEFDVTKDLDERVKLIMEGLDNFCKLAMLFYPPINVRVDCRYEGGVAIVAPMGDWVQSKIHSK
jgi:hypothetical protein